MGNSRAIIYEHQFQTELAAIEPDFFRADDCLRGLEWLLVRYPDAGHQSSRSPDVWYYPLVRDDFPPVCIYYAFDDENIWFLSIELLGKGNGHSE